MATLLHIDSSPLGDHSVSRALSAEYVKGWLAANPGGTVITRDLSTTVIPHVDAAWVAAAYTPAEHRTPDQRTTLALSDELIGELRRAETYVIGAPMHNFGIPSTLKLWIDQIARVGETFQYGEQGPVGLIEGKKATFLLSSGGDYGPGAAAASLNFVEPYLRAVFGFLGVKDVKDTDIISAGGAAALMSGGVDRETFLKPHFESIRSRFAA